MYPSEDDIRDQQLLADTSVPTCQEAVKAWRKGQRLARLVVDAYEDREQDTARRIHHCARDMLGALLHLRAYEKSTPVSPVHSDILATATNTLAEVIERARQLVLSLQLPFIEEFGLVGATMHMASRMNACTDTEIEFVHATDMAHPPMPYDRAVLRIIEELLNNACQHSQTSRVLVTLTCGQQVLGVEVRDWGIGFDLATKRGQHPGLERVRALAAAYDGCMTVDTAPGEGTRITVELPLIDLGTL